jgi:kumamolisin
LDIEWAHAMAPSAKLYLVEASSSSFSDLLNAEQVAVKCVQANTEGQISNSWGGNEFDGELADDSSFTGNNVEFFAAAGDYPGVSYPAASPKVISVGGTAFSRNQITGSYQSQGAWENEDSYQYFGQLLGTGGGPSAYEPSPSYQAAVPVIAGSARGTPDLEAIGDPATGVWVYNITYCGGWCVVGGTSVAAAITAAIFNELEFFYASTAAAMDVLYFNSGSFRKNYVTPILNGDCGPPGVATSGRYDAHGEPYDPTWIYDTTNVAWNWCTGWGYIH